MQFALKKDRIFDIIYHIATIHKVILFVKYGYTHITLSLKKSRPRQYAPTSPLRLRGLGPHLFKDLHEILCEHGIVYFDYVERPLVCYTHDNIIPGHPRARLEWCVTLPRQNLSAHRILPFIQLLVYLGLIEGISQKLNTKSSGIILLLL